MRIIAGEYKGRRLKLVDSVNVRPTSDRLRETVFNILAPRIEGARVLDLCAGSGAVGIEALSRGAASVTFVEANRRAVQVISDNLQLCRITEGVRVVNRDALTALKYFAKHTLQFDLVYFDPPYDDGLYGPVLWFFANNEILAEDGILLAEHRRQNMLEPNYDQLRPYRELKQGETMLTFYSKETAARQTPSEPTVAESAE